MKQTILIILVLAFATVYGQNNPVIPPCPDALMPVIEVQVNNTASNEDDYGSTTAYTICRARVTNVVNSSGNNNFQGGVPVELRNPSGMLQNLTFSKIAGTDKGANS